MSSVSISKGDRLQRLEKNAQLAEELIGEISTKLSEIEQNGHLAKDMELKRLQDENANLRMEVEKWKELLIIRQIRNGANPIIGDPETIGRAPQSAGGESNGAPDKQKSMQSISAKKAAESKTSLDGNHSSNAKAPRDKSPHTKSVSSGGNKDVKKDDVKKAKVTPSAGSAAPPATQGEVIDVSKLDFRIGLITEVERHPDADALYVEKIDLGEGKLRTIISGLVKHVPIEKMRNRLVVVLANLKPAKMRGIMSEGMVMCASSVDKIEILIPPQGSVPGDLVEIEGYPRKPEAVLNPKKKIFETVQPDLKTNDKKEATYKGKLWMVQGKGRIVAETAINSPIK